MNEVLVVENNGVTLRALIERLQEAGHSVIGAHDGKEAFDLIAAAPRRPSLILFDLSTPVVEGWDFWERQRNEPELSHIPVISISARVANTSGDRRDLLTTPVGIDALLALISQYC